MQSLFRILLSLSPVLLLAACGLPTGTLPEGTYTATLTGAVDTTYEGKAELERGRGLDEFEYAIHMFLPGRGPEYGIFLFFPDRPKAGRHSIARASPPTLKPGEVFAVASLAPVFGGTSGEVQISSSDPLRGSFEFVRQPSGSDTPVLQVQGEFTLK